jgi:hypothetical protein
MNTRVKQTAAAAATSRTADTYILIDLPKWHNDKTANIYRYMSTAIPPPINQSETPTRVFKLRTK